MSGNFVQYILLLFFWDELLFLWYENEEIIKIMQQWNGWFVDVVMLVIAIFFILAVDRKWMGKFLLNSPTQSTQFFLVLYNKQAVGCLLSAYK